MSDEGRNGQPDQGPESPSRRESVKLAAAILALGTGLGVPRQAFGLAPTAGRLQFKFYKGTTDGGALVGTVELTDAVSTYLESASGARTQIKLYDAVGTDLGTTALPSMYQEKLRSSTLKKPPGD